MYFSSHEMGAADLCLAAFMTARHTLAAVNRLLLQPQECERGREGEEKELNFGEGKEK